MKNAPASMFRRMFLSKTLGFLIGLLGFFILPIHWPEADPYLRWGILFWYTTFGAVIGLVGVMTHHPLWTGMRLPAWLRGAAMGAWLNLVLVFFAHDAMTTMLTKVNIGIVEPWWFVLEGAVLGLIFDLLATRFGGEGKEML